MRKGLRELSIPPLIRCSNYAKKKGITRSWAWQLVDLDELDGVEIDGVLFIIMNMKAVHFKRKRKAPN